MPTAARHSVKRLRMQAFSHKEFAPKILHKTVVTITFIRFFVSLRVVHLTTLPLTRLINRDQSLFTTIV